jgi:mono/diheme cytochrome c family protein
MKALRLLIPVLSIGLIAGCDDPRSSMRLQHKHDTYTSSEFFDNGTSARPLVAGTVSREASNVPGMPYARGGKDGVATGFTSETPANLPMPVTRELLERGQTEFNIYCAPCHGRLGNGEGMIVQRGMARPPSFHVPRLIDTNDGHFFNVITYGYGAMFSYNDRISPDDRWAITAYIRALQAAGASGDEATKAKLVARGDAATGGNR